MCACVHVLDCERALSQPQRQCVSPRVCGLHERQFICQSSRGCGRVTLSTADTTPLQAARFSSMSRPDSRESFATSSEATQKAADIFDFLDTESEFGLAFSTAVKHR